MRRCPSLSLMLSIAVGVAIAAAALLGFILVGYGTKAGIAPMHTWKPDAYREAPSPAGVLMAVGMVNGAKQIAEANGLQFQGATLAEMARDYRRSVPLESAQQTELELDTRGRAFNKS